MCWCCFPRGSLLSALPWYCCTCTSKYSRVYRAPTFWLFRHTRRRKNNAQRTTVTTTMIQTRCHRPPTAGTGLCVADALLLESESRFNDGSALLFASNGGAVVVTLDGMDGIVLSNGRQCAPRA